jgi:hypothetical protein
MYETLASGVANRSVSTQDLNIPDPPEGADPQIAAGFRPVTPAVVIPELGSAAVDGFGGMMPLENLAARDAVLTTWSSRHAAATKRMRDRGPGVSGTVFPIPGMPRRPVHQAALVDIVLSSDRSARSLLDLDVKDRPSNAS